MNVGVPLMVRRSWEVARVLHGNLVTPGKLDGIHLAHYNMSDGCVCVWLSSHCIYLRLLGAMALLPVCHSAC